MSHNQHPVRKTLMFFAAVWGGIFAFMARPQWSGGWLAEWPRWEATASSAVEMSPEEVQDILDAYASPVASLDSTVETTDSLTLADADSPVDVEPSASTTAESVAPIEGITAYDRGAIDQFPTS